MKNIIKHVRQFFRYTRLDGVNSRSIIQYIYLNYFCKNVKSSVVEDKYILPFGNCIFEFQSGSLIILHSTMKLGVVAIKGGVKESRLLMRKKSIIEVNNKVEISEGFDIQIQQNGCLILNLFHSNVNLEISCGNKIDFEGEVFCGRHVRIKDYNGHFVSSSKYPITSPISIKNHVWLCTGTTINPGVTVGESSVIADNSNVITDVPSYCLVQGNPAKIVEQDIQFRI